MNYFLQGSYFIFKITSGRWPLRARNVIECCGADECADPQPQAEPFFIENFRGRNFAQTKAIAASATIANETACCQSIVSEDTLTSTVCNKLFEKIFGFRNPA